MKRFSGHIGAGEDDLAWVCREAEEFCVAEGITQDRALRLLLVLDELATNAMTHGLPASGDPDIEVMVETDGAHLSLTIDASGPAFNPWTDADLSKHGEDYPGGRGLILVRGFAENVAYRRDGSRNVVTVVIAAKVTSD